MSSNKCCTCGQPIPEFRISDQGCGVYETRDGREATVERQEDTHYRWRGVLLDNISPCWTDGGNWRGGSESVHDLVRYLRPLPKPSVDPGEGWRLLGDEDVVAKGDEWWDRTDDRWRMCLSSVGMLVRDCQKAWSESMRPAVIRRRVTPAAQWTPTDERISLQKFTNGSDCDWRVV